MSIPDDNRVLQPIGSPIGAMPKPLHQSEPPDHPEGSDLGSGVIRPAQLEREVLTANHNPATAHVPVDGQAAGQSVVLKFDAPGGATVNCPQFIGDYEILGLLGSGGMGNVFVARNLFFGHKQALKMLHDRLDSDEIRKKFIQEMHAQAGLDHANIAKVHYAGSCKNYGSYRDRLYFVMPLEHGDFGARVKEVGPLSPREAANVVRRLAKAIAHAHLHKVIHCDLKPKNILIGKDKKSPKVTDFGLARILFGKKGARPGEGRPFGTPAYMPPEQAEGAYDRVNEQSDVYGLGAVLYELLTGQPPYEGSTRDEILRKVLDPKVLPVPPRQLDLDKPVPQQLEAICLKCLRKRPGQRYASALEVAEALNRFLRPPVWRRRWREGTIALLGAALAGIAWQALPSPRADAQRLVQRANDAILRAEQALKDGKRAQGMKDYADATADYEKVLRLEGGSGGTLGVAVDSDRAGRYPKVVATAARAYAVQAELHLGDRKLEEAKDALEAGDRLFDSDSPKPNEVPDVTLARAEVEHVWGQYYDAKCDQHQALERYRKGRDYRARLNPKDAGDDDHHWRDLARSHGYLGDKQLMVGQLSQARRSYREAMVLRNSRAEHLQTDIAAWCLHAHDFGNLATLEEWNGNEKAALGRHREKRKLYREKLGHVAILPALYRTDRAGGTVDLAAFLIDCPQLADSATAAKDEIRILLLEAEGEYGRLLDRDEDSPELLSAHARLQLSWAAYELRFGDGKAAGGKLKSAEESLARLDEMDKLQPDDIYLLATVEALYGVLPDTTDEDRHAHQVRASFCLEKAVRKGYLNRKRLERDYALSTLRTARPAEFHRAKALLQSKLDALAKSARAE